MKDCALICDHKVVIKIPCGANIANMILVLMAFCHTFNLEYSQEVEDVMELLQDKLLGLSEKKKHGVAYSNLYRSITCQQDKILNKQQKDAKSTDSDDTRLDDPIESQATLFRYE
jgi:hypothetical protein